MTIHDEVFFGLMFILLGVPAIFIIAGGLGTYLGHKLEIRSRTLKTLLSVLMMGSLVFMPVVIHNVVQVSMLAAGGVLSLWVFFLMLIYHAVDKPRPS